MAESTRLTILKRLTAVIQQITPVNGFAYDLSNAVFRGRTLFGDSDPKTMISILEASRPDPGLYAGAGEFRRSDWPLIIQGFTVNDPANPSDHAYELMAAVETQLGKIMEEPGNGMEGGVYPQFYCLSEGDTVAPRLIADLKYGPGVVSPPREQVSPQAFFFLPIWITLAGSPGKPYIQN